MGALEGKAALVTGASRGIGRAIARRLAREGARVVVNYKGNASAAQEVVAEIERAGGHAVALQGDVADAAAAQRLADKAADAFGRLDILINNAGWAEFQPLETATAEHFEALFSLNVRGLFFLTQAAARRMSDGGKIVNISSGVTRMALPGASVYSATKAAVEAFTRSWAAELGPRGITVNTVSPGAVETDLMQEVMQPEQQAAMAASSPLNRLGQPDDIADVVAFLVSPEARWVLGQNIGAGGGAF